MLYVAWKWGLPRKCSRFVLCRPIKKRSLSCVLDLWRFDLCQSTVDLVVQSQPWCTSPLLKWGSVQGLQHLTNTWTVEALRWRSRAKQAALRWTASSLAIYLCVWGPTLCSHTPAWVFPETCRPEQAFWFVSHRSSGFNAEIKRFYLSMRWLTALVLRDMSKSYVCQVSQLNCSVAAWFCTLCTKWFSSWRILYQKYS